MRQQGHLTGEERPVRVYVEQELGNPRLAANYAPGDVIQYKAGSQEKHGIADNSAAAVLAVDAKNNTLTVETSTGHEVIYNPALLQKVTGQSTIYREEERELAIGDRIRFTESDREHGIRSGSFATVERSADDSTLAVRLDSGKAVEFDTAQPQHLDYGYAVEAAKGISAERILLTGDNIQLAGQQEALTKLNPRLHDFAIYTNDATMILEKEHGLEAHQEIAEEGFSQQIDDLSKPSLEPEGYSIGL